MTDVKDFLWVESYRPKTIAETILPESLKKTFQQFVDQENVPNLILSGKQGIGKTTVAKALLNEIGADYIVINGSLERNIDTLRVKIANFASTVSFAGGRKYVILDEADYLNQNSFQPALRNFMEEFSKNCGFILTCNFKNRIIEPLHSRCSVIEFKVPNNERKKLAGDFFKRVCDILNKEGVTYDKKSVAEVVRVYFPDWRRALNELQRYGSTGHIDSGILVNKSADALNQLIDLMKAKDFDGIRKWVFDNNDIDSAVLYRSLFDIIPLKTKSKTSTAEAIITLADYQYKESFVANSDINRVACLVTLMVETDWK